MNQKRMKPTLWATLKKSLLVVFGIFAIFGVLGSGYLIIRDTGKMPPRPDKELDRILDEMEIEGRLCIAVSRFGNTIYLRFQPEGEVDERTPFAIGSLADQFVALSVLLLAERKELDTDVGVGTYLPGLPERLHAISVRHFLTQTSGLGPDSTLAGLALISAAPEPDVRSLYAPINYRVMERLIEATTQMSAMSFIRENLLAPLEMNHTYLDRETRPGGWVSCLEDLRKWEAALNTNRLVRLKTLLRFLQTARLADGSWGDYGGGWFIESVRGLRMEYGGAAENGTHAAIVRFSEKNFAVIILGDSSQDGLDTHALANTIGEVYLGREMPFPASQPSN